jgi:hypothetical protein
MHPLSQSNVIVIENLYNHTFNIFDFVVGGILGWCDCANDSVF